MNRTRREFLSGLTLAGTAGVLGVQPEHAAAEPPPETTRLRIAYRPGSVCSAPMYLSGEFLRGEGFVDVQYVKRETTSELRQAIASGEGDMTQVFTGPSIILVDAGNPIVFLAGVHVGCLELVGTDRVRAVRDLKGKTIAVPDLGGSQHIFLASMLAYVGLDPRKDVNWVIHPHGESMRLLAEKKVDAVLAIPPEGPASRSSSPGSWWTMATHRTSFRTNSRFPVTMQQKYCDQGRSIMLLTTT